MKVLLSPAKAIDITKSLNTKEYSSPVFMDEAKSLISKLSKFSAKKIGEMMHLSKELSDLNHQRYKDWSTETCKNDSNAPVSAAFNGEVYRGLDAPSMNEEQLKVAQDKIRILSGVYGVLKPMDIIYPYRLEMGTKWAVTPAKSNLYKFWGSKIAKALNDENESGVTINLASTEYFKAVDKKTLKGRVITPTFKEFKNGDYKVIMVFAKRARGSMARYIVDHNISNPEDLKMFDTDGYSFNANMSEEDNWVFTR
ncbi:MAG: peroxide stress protein YaaA [Crocinitomicaceae bacterium]|nr:peroxide stress protein YaaA [Crocinitomicaceae bacterium]